MTEDTPGIINQYYHRALIFCTIWIMKKLTILLNKKLPVSLEFFELRQASQFN